MAQVRGPRRRLAVTAVAVLLLVAGALLAGRLTDGAAPQSGIPSGHARAPAAAPEDRRSATPQPAVPAAWTRPTTRRPAGFARAFATAMWTYDTRLPYVAWVQAIGEWADPLGSPASGRVATAMLPPAPTYRALRAQSATARARIGSVVVPDAANTLAARAPAGWRVFVVRGTQHIITSTGTYTAERQASVAVVCAPTCWLYSATPELPQ
jgi:hypothetical protein